MTHVFALCALLSAPASAQDLTLPSLSPRAEVMQQVGVVEVTVNYSSPGKRDREIWGELVPYGELWRTGANRATTLTTTGDLTVGGEALPAGRYALFTIPGEEEWTVILNKNPDQGGTGSYDEALDQLRFTAKPQKGPARERLTFLFSDTVDTGASLRLEWDGVRVALPIEVDTEVMVKEDITNYVSAASGRFANAARHLAGNEDYEGALELIEASIAIEETWFNTWLKAQFLHDQEEHKQAYKLAKVALSMGEEAGDGFFWKDRVETAVAEWPKR